jgi:hypothetical protein
MSQIYQYTISTDFPNTTVSIDALTTEIEDSGISSGALEGVTLNTPATDTCYIQFDVALSASDVTTLDGIVAAHQGIAPLPLPSNEGWTLAVEDRDLTAPPGSPATGLCYIVAGPATGDWATHENCIASWNGTTWQFQRPSQGFGVWVKDENILAVYDGASWGAYGTGGGGSPAIFGSDLHTAESVAVSTTTSTSFQNKVSMVTGTLAGGTYRLEVSYGWSADRTNSNFLARVQQDGSDLGQMHEEEPKDAGGSFGSTGTDQKHYATRVYHLSLSAQSYTFTLDYGHQQAGSEASMWDAYMTLWRMS